MISTVETLQGQVPWNRLPNRCNSINNISVPKLTQINEKRAAKSQSPKASLFSTGASTFLISWEVCPTCESSADSKIAEGSALKDSNCSFLGAFFFLRSLAMAMFC